MIPNDVEAVAERLPDTTPDAITLAHDLPPEPPNARRFIITADFTGLLGSLGIYRFKPMVRVQKGERYEVSMDMTGATTFTPLGPDPFAAAKAESAELYRKFKRSVEP